MAKWLARWTPDQTPIRRSDFEPWPGSLCCFWAKHFTLSASPPRCIMRISEIMLGVNPGMDLHPIQGWGREQKSFPDYTFPRSSVVFETVRLWVRFPSGTQIVSVRFLCSTYARDKST